jgi:DNA polymerase III alpha subunit
MQFDNYGQANFSVDDLFEFVYAGKIHDMSHVLLSDPHTITQYNSSIDSNADSLAKLSAYNVYDGSVEDFDRMSQNQWLMPDKYIKMDIAEWLISQCSTDIELDRVASELDLFIQHNMMPVLCYLKYLVDSMREKHIVWGVGRGSSVASYCLFLIGIHKIDSIKYNLDITEFIK